MDARLRLPRLVATDLDGTLLRDDGSVSDRTRTTLRMLAERSIPVVVATARPLRWLDDLWPLFGTGAMGVVSNGAIWWDTGRPRRELRHLIGFDAPTGLALCDTIARATDATFAIETLAGLRLGPDFVDPHPFPPDTPRGELADVWDHPAVKVMVRPRDPSVLTSPEGWPRFREQVGRAVGTAGVASWSGAGLVEISAPGVTKAAGLAAVCAELGIDAGEVVAFGDMPNDLPMLRWAGLSYAMANGDPSVLATADRRAASNEEDGVATALWDLFDL